MIIPPVSHRYHERVSLATDAEPPAPDQLAAPAAAEGPRGSRLDTWWAGLVSTPARQRAWRWGGPLAVTLLAAILRLWNLGDPHSLVFDETFYVKDAWSLLHLGYEGSWPATPDPAFDAGDVDTYLAAPGYVVHPPLGKWIIALGLAVFGAENSFGWRVSVAVCGILAVLLVSLIGTKLFHSTLLGTIAGFLFAIDGHAIVMARIGILDGILMLFLLLGFGAFLLDREWHLRRLAERLAQSESEGREVLWGPAIWWRPWLLLAAIALGLATAVKWSGLYFLVAFALYTVLVDALARRRAGLPFWLSASILKQGLASFVLIVPLYLASYLVTWSGWFASSNGYYRNWAQTDGTPWTGGLAWVPLTIQNFWHFEASVYNFNVNEHSPHPYSANPFTWLFMIRPTQMYVNTLQNGTGGCGEQTCYENITSVGNAAIWWAATAAILFLVYRLIRRREWQVGLILMGMVGGYLPWLLFVNRTIFQFYTIAFEPYMILGLTFVIGMALGRRTDARRKRVSALWVVAGYLLLASVVTVFFWPVWTAQPIPGWLLTLHYWLPSWR
ncbi:phospholipid carrier-dependent glycosyltransferase [Subtercola boreus]|uniref:Polyprenol-phosphate-mannose--protein mannosyltransferase n=1 Tax=Subtercola boreus TaxID=120213 RepID=A0A3E0WAT4_9MICO|nr:phospholipid carrier-dependent glycosyltransferase [Subtercola boreus]RFA19955.1 phospholipid carrier-dependent glycosyltransferase [Subtercola boreus]RFA26348.1 phospholipid carrier-dependent glycosyltransferase [Subtercola boreus]